MPIACVNPGSSSVKLSVIDGAETLSQEDLPGDDANVDLASPLRLAEITAAAVRVVHGGAEFRTATLVDGGVLEQLRAISWMAPLHNPVALGLIDQIRAMRPGLPVVACFDTAYHATMPAESTTYPLPREWSGRWGLRRYGFHGLSHGYASRRAAELLGRRPPRLVSCHLGAGASLCAIEDGRSVDTTMGFTPMEGLMMATRSGSVDPGVVLFAMRQGLSADDIERSLDRESGMLGVSGTSADFRVVLAAAGQGDTSATLALALYRHRLVQGIAAMAASLGGIDALVFTGGVGENQASLRDETCAALRFLGIAPGTGAAAVSGADQRVQTAPGTVDVLVIKAREDLEMARQAQLLLGGR